MHLVYVPSDSGGTMYELKTYSKARTFSQRHASIGAQMLGKAKKIDNLDLIAQRVFYKGRKYNKKEVKNG